MLSTALLGGSETLVLGHGSALHNGEAHRAGGAGQHPNRGVDVVGVHVVHFDRGDFAQLGGGDAAGGGALADGRAAFGDAGGLLEEVGVRRRLGDEGEAAVGDTR